MTLWPPNKGRRFQAQHNQSAGEASGGLPEATPSTALGAQGQRAKKISERTGGINGGGLSAKALVADGEEPFMLTARKFSAAWLRGLR
jgi:hypothetical protein